MSGKNVGLIIEQVAKRLTVAKVAYEAGEYDNEDKEISELRDVLDDIYDRPEEEVETEPSEV